MSEINWTNFPGYPKQAKDLSQRGYEKLLLRCQEAERKLFAYEFGMEGIPEDAVAVMGLSNEAGDK